ncbi:hypothetical protein HY387_00850 [Candidatus Daviesbacteria bacterium]|nr:hypothetical protein [Candidatus Daviesbacteria bacterium]
MNSRGVSLIEILLVTVLVGFLVLLIGNLPNSINLIGKANHQSLAREIATKQIEDKRAISFVNLANGETVITDSRINLLPSGSGSVLVEDCNPLICTQGENTKQITVKVSWKNEGKNQEISLKTLISEGGLGQ